MNIRKTLQRAFGARRLFQPSAFRLSGFFLAVAFGALAIFTGGCDKIKQAMSGGAGKAGANPMAALMAGPPEVGVHTLKTEAVTLTRTLPARTSAYRVAEVRARVSGVVLKRLFVEGATVREGQQLYQIDDAPYVAALESAKAALARAQAGFANAQTMANRFAQLVQTNAVSKQDFDNATAQAKAAAADVAAATAAVDNAQINLSYTKVYSPITGRIGASQVTEGAYVQAATATLLATVHQLDPIYVDIPQASREVLALEANRAAGKLLPPPDGGFNKVTLLLNNGQPYARPGKLHFTGVSVDPSTSSVLLRSEFPNPAAADGAYALLPGMFVRAEIVEGISPAALLVPQQGVFRNQKGLPVAWVVVMGKYKIKDKEGNPIEVDMPLTELRVLTTERTIGAFWLVTDGVKPGEQVIVEGLQRVRSNGQPVKPAPAGQTPGALPIR